MSRRLTPQELAGLLASKITGNYRIGQCTGANPGQSVQIGDVTAIAKSVIPPGRAVAVLVNGQWQAYPEPAQIESSTRVIQQVRRNPPAKKKVGIGWWRAYLAPVSPGANQLGVWIDGHETSAKLIPGFAIPETAITGTQLQIYLLRGGTKWTITIQSFQNTPSQQLFYADQELGEFIEIPDSYGDDNVTGIQKRSFTLGGGYVVRTIKDTFDPGTAQTQPGSLDLLFRGNLIYSWNEVSIPGAINSFTQPDAPLYGGAGIVPWAGLFNYFFIVSLNIALFNYTAWGNDGAFIFRPPLFGEPNWGTDFVELYHTNGDGTVTLVNSAFPRTNYMNYIQIPGIETLFFSSVAAEKWIYFIGRKTTIPPFDTYAYRVNPFNPSESVEVGVLAKRSELTGWLSFGQEPSTASEVFPRKRLPADARLASWHFYETKTPRPPAS